MTVRIREQPYTTSSGKTYQVRRDEVRGHLMIIASGGSSDIEPSFGDSPDLADANYSVVAYNPNPVPDTSTPAGVVRARLKTLVDQADAYEVVGVPGDTIWSDGSNVEAQPAFTLGNTVFYDTSSCNGNGRWIVGTNGNHECTQSAAILYHELAHAFHDHGAGTVAQEEAEAITDENDLRTALGLVPRDPNRINGGCGCPDSGCCIVASVAFGSPYAAEINALRRLRDFTLRSTPLGAALFDALHREYYGFSIDVCRIMVTDKRALSDVDSWLVRPLARTLTALAEYTRRPDEPERAGRLLIQSLHASRTTPEGHQVDWTLVGRLLEALAAGVSPAALAPNLGAGTAAVCDVLARALPSSPHVRWGILHPLTIHASAAAQFAAGGDPYEVGSWLAKQTEQWLGELPLEEILSAVSPDDASQEIAALAASVFKDGPQQLALIDRLLSRAGLTQSQIPGEPSEER